MASPGSLCFKLSLVMSAFARSLISGTETGLCVVGIMASISPTDAVRRLRTELLLVAGCVHECIEVFDEFLATDWFL